MNNYTVSILNAYYRSSDTDPCSIYRPPKVHPNIPNLCNCQQLANYIMNQDHYSGFGGPHRTRRLDEAERKLVCSTASGKLPDNRRTYVLNSGIIDDNDDGPGILVFVPVRSIEELHLVLCYNLPSIKTCTNLTDAIRSDQLFSNNKDLALIVGCRTIVDKSFKLKQTKNIIIRPKKYTPRYLLSIRFPTQHVSILTKLSRLFM